MHRCDTSRKSLLLLLTISLLAVAPPDSARAAGSRGYPGKLPAAAGQTDRLIIKYRQSAKVPARQLEATDLAQLSSTAGVQLRHLRPMSGNGQVVRLPARVSLDEARSIAARLQARDDIEYAVPDRRMFPLQVPDDPRYAEQWNYLSPTSDGVPGGANLPGAWGITTGSTGVVAAVVDTGIVTHADLAGRTVPGYNFIHNKLDANNDTGRSNDPADLGDWITQAESDGTDPVAGDYFKGCDVSDSSWHGTHVAGTIGATSNNGTGVTGINWTSRILPVRVLGKCGGWDSDIIDGMRWAAGLPVAGVPDNANPARVINLSLGGDGPCDPAYQSAIDEILARGTAITVAAGNSNGDAGSSTPANCTGVITVAAVDRFGGRAWYSNFGSIIKIAAPGGSQTTETDPGGILSTLNAGTKGPIPSPNGDTYGFYQGTSMATPHVTGIVSLMFSVNPDLTPTELLTRLQSSARAFPVGTGSDCSVGLCGAGIVDATAAVNAAQVAKTPVDGVCGPSNGAGFIAVPTSGLCSTGDASPVTGSGPWTWNCSGLNGGTTASCTARRVVPISVNGDAPYATKTSVTLTLGIPTGYSSLHLSNNGTRWGRWLPVTPSMPWRLSAGDGLKTVYVQFRTPAGLVTPPFESQIILDRSRPTGRIVINDQERTTASREVTVTITATDRTSGLDSLCLSESTLSCSDSAFIPFAPTMQFTLASPDNGRKRLYAILRDKAGNRSRLLHDTIILKE
jgi:serine protease